MTKPTLPKGLISTATLAKIMGGEWDADMVRRMLKRTGAGFQIVQDDQGQPSGAWYTTRSRLRDLSPELFEELCEVEF